MAVKRNQPLFEEISNTEVTPLAKSLRERLQASSPLAATGNLPDGDGAKAIPIKPAPDLHELRLSQVARHAELDDLEPLANLLMPPPSASSMSRPSRISKQMVIKTIERHPWWLGILAFVTVVSLAVNGVSVLALRSVHRQLHAAQSRLVTGAVMTSNPSAQGALGEAPACVAESTQTISGSDRDRMLLDAIRQHEAGRRAESLASFKRYIKEACDAATLETVAILEQEINPKKKERTR